MAAPILSLFVQDLSTFSFHLASNSLLRVLYWAQENTKGDDFMKRKFNNFLQNILLFYADFFTHQTFHC